MRPYHYLLGISFTCLSSLNFATTAPQAAPSFLHLDWLDTKMLPEKDFYIYANGGWKLQNPIPPEYATWGSFSVLAEKVQNQVHELLQQAAANKQAAPGSIEQKIGDFYHSGMDVARINQLGISPLQPYLDKISAIKTTADLQDVISQLQMIGVDAIFGFDSMQDFKNSKLMIAIASQGGLGLPDRDYYLKDDAKFKEIRQAYVDHVAKMFELLGETPELAAQKAATVMNIETILAKASMAQADMRDPRAIYHIKTLAELQKLSPNFSWSRYFNNMGLPKLTQINLATPEFFNTVNQQLAQTSLDDWKTYLRWHLIDAYASYLSEPFVAENFRMVQALYGTKKILPRWKRVVATENSLLGFAIGKEYVAKYFSPESKKQALLMLKNIRTTLESDLKTLSWMSEATRQAALKKLALIEERVGYPDKWRDYSNLKITRDAYAENVMRGNTFSTKRELNKIGKPVDRSEWGMTPQTINAYYDPSMNNINIPAGILQAPFFDPQAPAAMNYGGIGFVMGHEIIHGFDDQGSQFDGHGNLKNWWTKADLEKFKQATQCIVDQFSNYTVEDNLHVQGKLVVGEATADLGGLNLAYRAFHNSKAYKEAKDWQGLTPDQQFFISSAHVWATNIRPLLERNLVTTDPHPPARFRVNGTLANMPEFHKAFAISAPSPMISIKPCIIW